MSRENLRKRLDEINRVLIPRYEIELVQASSEASTAQKRVSNLQKGKAALEGEAVEITVKLSPKVATKPVISDHALIRYLERAHGFNLDKFRDEILNDNNIGIINSGASKIKANGVELVIRDKVVVTVT